MTHQSHCGGDPPLECGDSSPLSFSYVENGARAQRRSLRTGVLSGMKESQSGDKSPHSKGVASLGVRRLVAAFLFLC